MITLDDFSEVFKPKLGGSIRWNGFSFIAQELISLGRPITIVETGCARKKDNWDGDGQSTLVWDWLIGKLGGSGVSFDISADSVAVARTLVTHMQVVQADSVTALRAHDVSNADLIYLDSMDISEPIISATHHLAELASIYVNLREGCMIAVDDCFDPHGGKDRFVRAYFAQLGIEPVISGKVSVWRKPASS